MSSKQSTPVLRSGLEGDAFSRPDLLARIVEIAEDAIVSVDSDSKIRLFNQGAERIFGYSAGEVLGRPLSVLIPPRFRHRHAEDVENFAKSPTQSRAMAQRGDIFGLRADGSEFPAEASISKLDIEGSQVLTVILRDVSETRRVERTLRSALAEKEILLREIHHRVKNNLQVVSSLMKLQARAAVDADLQVAFEECQNRIQSMALIHEQLYESVDFADVDFPEYIRQLAQRLFRSYEVNPGRVELYTDIGAVRLGVDIAVPCGLILNELLSNSLKYAFPGDRPGSVTIRVEKMKDESVLMTISDSGVGLPPDVGFWNTKTLGLRLVRLLVRQLDGEIALGGPPGTEFRIRFSPEGPQA